VRRPHDSDNLLAGRQHRRTIREFELNRAGRHSTAIEPTSLDLLDDANTAIDDFDFRAFLDLADRVLNDGKATQRTATQRNMRGSRRGRKDYAIGLILLVH
jgi:hypothetical protein